MGIREYDHEDQKYEIKHENPYDIEDNLNKLYKDICLCIGWSLVLILSIWILIIYECGH